jgi:cytochrome c oxidase cbb3-type subunit 4
MNYHALREFADSWGLVLMGVAFVGLIGWAFRPNSDAATRRAATSIFEEDQADG